MEPRPLLLLLLLLAAPWGRDWAVSGHASAEEMTRSDGPSVRPGEPGKCHETSMTTTSPCNNVCSSKGSTGCGQECQQGEESCPPSSPMVPTEPVLCCLGEKEDFYPRTDPDLKTNCINKCGDDSNCRGSRKCCRIRCRFCCPQPVPARPDTYPKNKVPHTIGCCNSTCSSDSDCPNHLRCCSPRRRSSRFSAALSLLSWGCQLVPDHRPCRRYICCYAYNPASRSCQVFVQGCSGNANDFHSVKEFRQVCQHGLDKC